MSDLGTVESGTEIYIPLFMCGGVFRQHSNMWWTVHTWEVIYFAVESGYFITFTP